MAKGPALARRPLRIWWWLLGPPLLVARLGGLGRDRLLGRGGRRRLAGGRGRLGLGRLALAGGGVGRGGRRRGHRLGRRGRHRGPAGRLERVGQARHLGSEQLADLSQVGGDALLLLAQLVDLALRGGAVPLDLAPVSASSWS